MRKTVSASSVDARCSDNGSAPPKTWHPRRAGTSADDGFGIEEVVVAEWFCVVYAAEKSTLSAVASDCGRAS